MTGEDGQGCDGEVGVKVQVEGLVGVEAVAGQASAQLGRQQQPCHRGWSNRKGQGRWALEDEGKRGRGIERRERQ